MFTSLLSAAEFVKTTRIISEAVIKTIPEPTVKSTVTKMAEMQFGMAEFMAIQFDKNLKMFMLQ